MAKRQHESKHGGNRKIGRNLVKCNAYKVTHTREKHKINRILRSSGEAEALRYADRCGLAGYLALLCS